jgi:hypothetical protein
MVEATATVGTEQTITETTKTMLDTQGTETTEAEGKDESTLLGEEEKQEVKSTAPEKYEFKVPEGIELDTKLVDAVTPIFKEIGISQEHAQKLFDAYTPYVQQQMKVQQEEAITTWNKQINDWKAETTKELGANLKTELSLAGKFIQKYGTPKLREILNETGLGNHPEVVKAFAKAGKSISEDTFVDPGKTKKPTEGIDLKKMYPSMQTT